MIDPGFHLFQTRVMPALDAGNPEDLSWAPSPDHWRELNNALTMEEGLTE